MTGLSTSQTRLVERLSSERTRVSVKLIFKTIGLVKTLISLAVLAALIYLFVQYNPWLKNTCRAVS